MATITFSNGATVNFNGTPTQADIEEVAQRISAKAPAPAAPPQPNAAQRVGSAISQDVGTVKSALNANAAVQQGGGSTLNKLGSEFATGAHIAAAVTDAPFHAATAALPQGIQDTIGHLAHGAGSLITSNPQAAAALAKVHQLAIEHPQVAEFLSGIGSTAANIAGIEGGVGAAKGLASKASDISSTVKGADAVASATKPVTLEPLTAAPAKLANPQAEKVVQLISPKLTPAERTLALKDGRIRPGEKPGFLSDGTVDSVLPKGKDIQAANSIAEAIPNAHTMSQPELYTQLNGQVARVAQTLRPQLSNLPIGEGTVHKITEDWAAIKAKQLANPYSPFDSAKIQNIQQHFEREFLMGSKSDNLNDLWNTSIKYDKSIPTNVKNANSMSSETLQAHKAIWLQNRGVLREAIDHAAQGLPEAPRKAFMKMSDMYQGMRNIESSYQLPKTGAPSGIKKALTSKPAKIIEGVAAGAGVYEVGKKLIGR